MRGVCFLLVLLFSPMARADDAKPEEKKKEEKTDREGTFKSCTEGEDTKVAARLATGCSMIGLRFVFTGLDVPARGITAGVAFHTQGEDFDRWNILSVHATHRTTLGGGGSGFEGELSGSVTVGVRAPLAKHHGPFVRGGVSGHVLGNDLFYGSLIEFPRGEVGYQFMSGITVVEAGMTFGYAIDGRYGQRNLVPLPYSPLSPTSGFAWGGYVALQAPHMQLGVSLEGVPMSEGASGTIMNGLASACAYGYIFALCFDVRILSQDGLGPFGNSIRSTYWGGVTLGFTGKK